MNKHHQSEIKAFKFDEETLRSDENVEHVTEEALKGDREAFCAIKRLKWFNPLTAKLFNLNFHPLEVVSRCRDSQLQVIENY